jgi:hypothetical protein
MRKKKSSSLRLMSTQRRFDESRIVKSNAFS